MPATQILVIGDQGTGKSTAWETMDQNEVLIITPNAKSLPWGGSTKQYEVGKNRIQTKKLTDVPGVLEKVNKDLKNIKYVLIEDLTHFFNARTTSADFVAQGKTKDSYSRWGELANDIKAVIDLGDNFRDDLFIIYNAHSELKEEGIVGMLTPGKLLDRDIKLPSYFTYVFHSVVVKSDKGMEYKFLTNKDGTHDAKTPKGCFKDLLVTNDMKMIIKRIRDYQEGK